MARPELTQSARLSATTTSLCSFAKTTSRASGAMATAGVANNSVDTKIFGNVNIGSNADANNFLTRLTKNQELANKGMTI